MQSLRETITTAYAMGDQLQLATAAPELINAVEATIDKLESGECRVAEYRDGEWQVNLWLKQAILLYFRLHQNQTINGQFSNFYDKIPLQFSDAQQAEFQARGVRVVPPAVARKGAYIAPNTVLMPSYINIGAYVDSGCLIDTWATVGSCAQIGKHVHLSGGAGIGGILEPLQSHPNIIEDNVFIGARAEIVEGMLIERDAVIAMGVYLGQSTRIYNRLNGEVSYGRVPAGSVVVPGSLPAKDGSHSLNCAVIVKQVDDKTREKVALNELLRIPD
jgi:2,3,4,5-tetrahydropyridine-2,6-dicarboxylate N-succinyltransferase